MTGSRKNRSGLDTFERQEQLLPLGLDSAFDEHTKVANLFLETSPGMISGFERSLERLRIIVCS